MAWKTYTSLFLSLQVHLPCLAACHHLLSDLGSASWGVPLVRCGPSPHCSGLRRATDPGPHVGPWSPQMRYLWPVSHLLLGLLHSAHGDMHSLCHKDTRRAWNLQRGQAHRIYHVYHVYHLAGIHPHILWHITICRKGEYALLLHYVDMRCQTRGCRVGSTAARKSLKWLSCSKKVLVLSPSLESFCIEFSEGALTSSLSPKTWWLGSLVSLNYP